MNYNTKKNKIHEGIADSLFSELTNFQNLSALVKSVAYGMPIALLVGFFPQILNSFITDMPQFFADKKFAKEFQKYCTSRAEELKKTPDIQNAIRKGNTKELIAAIKKNMSSKDEKIHREALHRGLGKRQSDIDPLKYTGERDSGYREDIIAQNLKGTEDHDGGIYPKLAKILKSKKKPSALNAKEEPEEFLAGSIPAMAESKNTMKKSELKALIQEVVEEVSKMENPCWKGYKAYGTKNKGGKEVPNCVPVNEEEVEEIYESTKWDIIPEGDEHTCEGDEFYEMYGDIKYDPEKTEEAEYKGKKVKLNVPYKNESYLDEAKYHGKNVPLGKKIRGDVKKFKTYVRKPNGKIVKVNYGDKNMRIKKSNPKRRKSFRARHNCKNPGPRWKARYWSCRAW